MAVWIGWLVALIAAVALGLLWQWLRREIAERADVESEHATLDAQVRELRGQHEQVMRIDHLAGLGQLLASAAPQLVKPLSGARVQVGQLTEQWIEYRNVVAAYDEAVQHCLAPLDMLVGTDTADLDPAQLQRVVQHVETARRRLFEARAALVSSPFGHQAPAQLKDVNDGLDRAEKLLKGVGSGPRPGDVGTELVDCNQALESALVMASAQIGERIRVVQRCASELPSVRGSIAQLHQVLLHLVANACEAIPGEGTLTVETRLGDPGTIEIDIADTGVGISDDVLPRVFEAFFTTRPLQQAGLGLSVVHRIVKAHHGSIQVRTQPGSGTRFTIALPISGRAANNVTPLFRQRESA